MESKTKTNAKIVLKSQSLLDPFDDFFQALCWFALWLLFLASELEPQGIGEL